MKSWTRTALLAALLLSVVGMLVYSTWIEPQRIEVIQHDMRKAPEAVGFRLVQVSDLHLRGYGQHEKGIAQKIKDMNADVVVLSGDAIDRQEAIPWLRSFVKELGGVPVLHVLGNWEHWSDLSLESMNSTGARLLLNEKWELTKGQRRLEIMGLDDYTAGQPDLSLISTSSSSSQSKTTVLVQHSPGFFDQARVVHEMNAKRFELCLAGHTHGGQVAMFGWAPFKPVGSGRFTAGFYDVPGCPLYVSRGLGTSVLPIRFGSKPELVVFHF